MKSRYLWLSVLLTVIAALVSVALYSRLPAQMPTHWGINGQVDGYSPRALGAFGMPAFMAVLVALFWLLRWMSPKNFEVDRFGPVFEYVMFCIVALMGYLHGMILWASIGQVQVDRALLAGIFLFFAILGNVMGKVKRNFWMGIRTPWTLASESVWNQTHRFGARVYVIVGAAGLVLTLAGASPVLLFVWLIVGSLVPVPYSLYLSKREQGSSGASPSLLIGLAVVALLGAGLTAGLLAITPRSAAPRPELAAAARDLVTNMGAGDFAGAESRFDARMRAALTPGQLASAWQSLETSLGKYKGQSQPRAETLMAYDAVYVPCTFERGRGDIKVVFSRDGSVSGLWFQPAR